MAAEIPGIYVPSFYDVWYKEDGTIDRMVPVNPHAPDKVSKQLVMDMDATYYPEKPVVPFIKVTQDTCCAGNYARLHPRLPFLPGWYGIPPCEGGALKS